MTLEELKSAQESAARRDGFLVKAKAIEVADCPNALFGFVLDPEMEEVLRTACAGELRRRAALHEADLRELGVVIPAPAPTLRSPSSWDEATGEFTFGISSTGPEPDERLLGYAGPIAVDQVILPRGIVSSRRPMLVVASGRTKENPIGEVVRIWEEGGQILGRAMLFPEASAARAAVAGGAVADVGWMFNVCVESVTQREGLRPLVTVEQWNLEGAVLISDDPSLGKLDPRDECPGKAKAD